jgi:hypothetical protein
MDQTSLVDQQFRDGWRLIERLARDDLGVAAAGWVKRTDDGRWYLTIASPFVDREGPGKAYRHVQAIMRQMSPPLAVAPLGVKLVGARNPLAQVAARVEHDLPAKALTRYRGPDLDKLAADDAYIYPVSVLDSSPSAAAPENGSPLRRAITLVSEIRQEGDTLVVKRTTIALPPGAEVIAEGTETSPAPSGLTKVRYEDE